MTTNDMVVDSVSDTGDHSSTLQVVTPESGERFRDYRQRVERIESMDEKLDEILAFIAETRAKTEKAKKELASHPIPLLRPLAGLL